MADEKIKHEYNDCVFNYNYTTSLIPVGVPMNQKPPGAEPHPDLLSFIKSRIDIKLSDTIIADILNAEEEFYGRQP